MKVVGADAERGAFFPTVLLYDESTLRADGAAQMSKRSVR